MEKAMSQTKLASLQPYMRSLMRMVLGFTFSLHGFQKLFGLLGGMRGSGATAELFSLIWFAGCLEAFGGLLIFLGLFTAPVTFLLSGQMAVAYFIGHFPRGFWPILNGGELAIVYCFVFLYFFTAGPGPWSLDYLRRRRQPQR
jgi:putative oxidoreductase